MYKEWIIFCFNLQRYKMTQVNIQRGKLPPGLMFNPGQYSLLQTFVLIYFWTINTVWKFDDISKTNQEL